MNSNAIGALTKPLLWSFCLMLTACTTSPTGRSQFMLISPEAAIVQSQKAYQQTIDSLRENKTLSDDQRLADRVQRITGRLITVAQEQFPESRSWDWSVALIADDDTVNAWCMAGGRMAVYTGLFAQLDLTDDEFAQIMGHEIAHALAHHSAEKISRALAAQIGLTAITASSGNSQAVSSGAELAATLALELPNSRIAESEADVIGLELATLTGFDPKAAVTLWQKMGALSERRPPAFLSTHPDPSQRLSQLAQQAETVPGLNPNRVKAPIFPVTIIYQQD